MCLKRLCYDSTLETQEKVAIENINTTAKQIEALNQELLKNKVCKCKLKVLYCNIKEALQYWTDYTYIGVPKEELLKKVYQSFFCNLSSFLLCCIKCKNSTCFFRTIAKECLYRGKIFRYLGHTSGEPNKAARIKPIFDNIYVSWSKRKDISSIQSKLYGTTTLLTCEIKEPFYGIDLAPFGVVKKGEYEVIFPTIKEGLEIEIEYIKDEGD